jgi:hypothetical protein
MIQSSIQEIKLLKFIEKCRKKIIFVGLLSGVSVVSAMNFGGDSLEQIYPACQKAIELAAYYGPGTVPQKTKDVGYCDYQEKWTKIPQYSFFLESIDGKWEGPTLGMVLKTDENSDQYLIAFRGTRSDEDLKIDLDCAPQSLSPFGLEGQFHKGFLSLYLQKVRSVIGRIANQNPNAHFSVTGHSMGAGLATLAALDLANRGCTVDSLLLFGSPQLYKSGADLIEGKIGKNRIVSFEAYGDPFSLLPLGTDVRPIGVRYGQTYAFKCEGEGKEKCKGFTGNTIFNIKWTRDSAENLLEIQYNFPSLTDPQAIGMLQKGYHYHQDLLFDLQELKHFKKLDGLIQSGSRIGLLALKVGLSHLSDNLRNPFSFSKMRNWIEGNQNTLRTMPQIWPELQNSLQNLPEEILDFPIPSIPVNDKKGWVRRLLWWGQRDGGNALKKGLSTVFPFALVATLHALQPWMQDHSI